MSHNLYKYFMETLSNGIQDFLVKIFLYWSIFESHKDDNM